MRILIVASLLLLPLAAADAVEFAPPATFTGTTEVMEGEWIIISVLSDEVSQLSMEAAGTLVTHDHADSRVNWPAGDQLAGIQSSVANSEPQEAGPWESSRVEGPRLLMLIHTDSLSLTYNGTLYAEASEAGNLPSRPPGGHFFLATIGNALGVEQAFLRGMGSWVIEGMFSEAEWIGLDCPTCPDYEERPVNGSSASIGIRRSVEFAGAGKLQISGRGDLWVLSPTISLNITGVSRLPLIDTNGTQKTMTMDGSTLINELRPGSNGRMQANIQSHDGRLFLDEKAVSTHWDEKVAIAAAVGLGVLAAALIGREILGAPLRNEKRRELYCVIQERPGLHFRELRRSTGLGNGALVYALGVLTRAGLIESRIAAGRRCYYANIGKQHDPRDEMLAHMDIDRVKTVVELIARHPAITRPRLVKMAQSRGMSRAAAYRVVAGLSRSGCITVDDGIELQHIPLLVRRSPESLEGAEG